MIKLHPERSEHLMSTHPLNVALQELKQMQESAASVASAALLLGLTKGTIYRYIREGLLIEVDTPSGAKKVSSESIEELQRKLFSSKLEDEGISLNAFVKKMNITKKRLLELLQKHNIVLEKTTHGQREQYWITPAIEERVHCLLLEQEHFPKTVFFNSKRNMALFQAYVNIETNKIYRIERDADVWGIRVASGIVPFEIAEAKYKLRPQYSIRQRLRSTTVYATLVISMEHELFFDVMDTLYQIFGIDNLQFQYEADTLKVMIKDARYILSVPIESVQQLQEFLVNSTLQVETNAVKISNADYIVHVPISAMLLPSLLQQSKLSNMTETQFIQSLLEAQLNGTKEGN